MGVVNVNNRPMELVEQLREEVGVSKSKMARCCGISRAKYYEDLGAKDIKYGVLKKYLRVLGWKLILTRDNMEI